MIIPVLLTAALIVCIFIIFYNLHEFNIKMDKYLRTLYKSKEQPK